MKKTVFSSRKLRTCVWLVSTLLILSLYSTPNALGGIYDFMTQQSNISAMAPSVVLENGTAGTSTIYANGTSAITSVGGSYWTYYPNGYSVLTGTYVSGSVPTSVETVDTDYFTVKSAGTASSTPAYNPSNYSLLGNTTLDSGATGDLVSDNGAYMTFRSYDSATSAQTLYAHQETTTIGGTSYYLQKLENASAAGTSLSASMAATGRQSLGKFVYPLTGVSSIPTSTWTLYYRGWHDALGIAFDAQSSKTQNTTANPISWSHTTGTGSNRLLLVAIGVHKSTGAPTTVTSVTYGGVSLTQVTTALYDGSNPQVRTYIFQLTNPASGTNTITVNFQATTLAVAGAVTYSNVDQTTPIQTSNAVNATGASPSVSVTVTGNGRWLFGHLGGHQTSAWTITEGAGQTNRWAQEGQLYKGRGSDKSVSDGSQSMSWSLNIAANYVASAVVINPAIVVGHLDADILVRKSDGTVRTTIATNVANSGDLTSTPTTLWGTYAWALYIVVDQTDYLEIDYYVEVTTALSGKSAYLRIDDSNLALADQTRTTNISLPSEYTSEVEFTGSSNTYTWTQLDWTVDSAWDTGSVVVTLQLYNYSSPGGYPTSGDGYISYTSNATADTDETKTQSITLNPQNFRDASGNWSVKIKGVKSTSTQFKFKADWIEFKTKYYSEYTASTEFTFSSMTTTTPSQLNFTIVIQYDLGSVSVSIQVYNYTGLSYSTSGQGCLNYTSSSTPNTDETKFLLITTNPQDFVSGGNATIKITGTKTAQTQFQQKTNQLKLDYKSAGINYNHVLKVVNTVPEAWQIRLTAYAQSGIDRLQNLTIYVYDGSNSTQIIILNGLYNQQTGPWYDLADYDTEYIWVHVETSSAGASYIYTYLEILSPNTTTYARYVITFKIT